LCSAKIYVFTGSDGNFTLGSEFNAVNVGNTYTFGAIQMNLDGSRFTFASDSVQTIMLATWAGTTYSAFTSIDSCNIQAMSKTGKYLGYFKISTLSIYISTWNGTTYPTGTLICAAANNGGVEMTFTKNENALVYIDNYTTLKIIYANSSGNFVSGSTSVLRITFPLNYIFITSLAQDSNRFFSPWADGTSVLTHDYDLSLYTKSPYTSIGSYQGGSNTGLITSSTNGIAGEWLQIQIPMTGFLLKSYTFSTPDTVTFYGLPTVWYIFGSIDGNTWVQLDTRTNTSPTSQTINVTGLSMSVYYKYFRFLANQIYANSSNQLLKITDFQLKNF
jgi:hypothetical protein